MCAEMVNDLDASHDGQLSAAARSNVMLGDFSQSAVFSPRLSQGPITRLWVLTRRNHVVFRFHPLAWKPFSLEAGLSLLSLTGTRANASGSLSPTGTLHLPVGVPPASTRQRQNKSGSPLALPGAGPQGGRRWALTRTRPNRHALLLQAQLAGRSGRMAPWDAWTGLRLLASPKVHSLAPVALRNPQVARKDHGSVCFAPTFRVPPVGCILLKPSHPGIDDEAK
ncbi:hypothetical protein FALBO_3816 [Fusarium albosuccineum]|uniref:Uncharacterized protein n=1 Tax=Fusarium albosuccineum TaxID=1237068 RepID=A0A8H4LKG3_9HYPO|nr:hypothetical protein FALBO_3816 [Fusarium albosuccineum]